MMIILDMRGLKRRKVSNSAGKQTIAVISKILPSKLDLDMIYTAYTPLDAEFVVFSFFADHYCYVYELIIVQNVLAADHQKQQHTLNLKWPI
jgi:hypothetical protein